MNKKEIIKPTSISTSDTNVEIDLLGKDLKELSEDKITLLARDLPLFNDAAFRYYLFQFIDLVLANRAPFSKDAFIQDLFESNLLNKRTNRYLQFSKDEIDKIIQFLNEMMKDELIKEDWEKEINASIIFWEEHPNLREK